MKKKIILCSSISFYEDVVKIKQQLLSKGFLVVIPELAEKMEAENNFDIEVHRKSYLGTDPVGNKGKAIKTHFKKIPGNDAMLIVNKEKHNKKGYIGPNVLMEMGIAFHEDIPIFILHEIQYETPFMDEIEGMKPFPLKGNLDQLMTYLNH